MGSAVYELQKAIANESKRITQLLRETKLIAAKLVLQDVEKWVDYELKGYPKGIEIPDYRKFKTSHVEIRHPFRGWEFAGNYSMLMRASQPISEIEELSKQELLQIKLTKQLPVRDLLGGGMGGDWPQRAVIANSEFKRIVEAVTDELLQWTVELEKRGIKGEDMLFNEKEKQSATTHIFNIQKFAGVFGNVNNSAITLHDYTSIHQLLKDQNVPRDERNKLEDIMDELKSSSSIGRNSLLKKGKAWLEQNQKMLGDNAETIAKAIGLTAEK